jgi:hypothetical protein
VNDIKININGIARGIHDLSPEDIGEHGIATIESGGNLLSDLFSDPSGLVSLLLDDAKNAAFAEFVIQPLVGRYLKNGTMTGDQYLKSMGVVNGIKGLQFYGFDYFNLNVTSDMNSSLIDRYGNISIIARYDVAYTFWGLRMPFADPTKLSITQNAQTKAWIGGKGERYTP